MRQLSIADITFSWPRLTWPALASRQAAPWSRKMSATSSGGRLTAAASGVRLVSSSVSSLSRSSGLMTARMVLVATCA